MARRSDVAVKAKEIVQSGKYKYGQSRTPGYLTDDLMDCSEFVYQAHRAAGFASFPAYNTKLMNEMFDEVDIPESGDIVYWSKGHVGVIDNPATGTFWHAASSKSGLRTDSYKSGYWSVQPGRKFLRYSE